MAHQRFRKYNTKDFYAGQALDNDLAMAVRAGNRIWLRGQTGHDFDGNFVGEGDAAAQAENAMHCVKVLLEEAGAEMGHRQDHCLSHGPQTSRSGLCCRRALAEGRLSMPNGPYCRRPGEAGNADGDRCRSGHPGK